MEKKHINVVCAVVCDGNDHVLCMQRCRSDKDYISEHWEFPGGKVEPGETDAEALERELKEEMDWDVTTDEMLGSVYYEYPDFTITLTGYTCFYSDFDFKLLEHLDARWLTRKEMLDLNWTAADRLLMEKLFKYGSY